VSATSAQRRVARSPLRGNVRSLLRGGAAANNKRTLAGRTVLHVLLHVRWLLKIPTAAWPKWIPRREFHILAGKGTRTVGFTKDISSHSRAETFRPWHDLCGSAAILLRAACASADRHPVNKSQASPGNRCPTNRKGNVH
jgi:hypothetical protein